MPNHQNVFGKCSLFPRESLVANYLVAGIDDKLDVNNYFMCSTARTNEEMCGNEGKKFQRKYQRKTQPGKEAPSSSGSSNHYDIP